MATSPRFLPVKAVAEELAITENVVYTLLRSGDLPAIQIGPKRVWRIERAQLEGFIERQYAAAREEACGSGPEGAHGPLTPAGEG